MNAAKDLRCPCYPFEEKAHSAYDSSYKFHDQCSFKPGLDKALDAIFDKELSCSSESIQTHIQIQQQKVGPSKMPLTLNPKLADA